MVKSDWKLMELVLSTGLLPELCGVICKLQGSRSYRYHSRLRILQLFCKHLILVAAGKFNTTIFYAMKKNKQSPDSTSSCYPSKWLIMVSIGLLSFMLHFLFPLIVTQYSNNRTESAQFAASICQQLHRDLGPVIILPSSLQYTILSDENWSETAWKQPSCIAQPDSL